MDAVGGSPDHPQAAAVRVKTRDHLKSIFLRKKKKVGDEFLSSIIPLTFRYPSI